MASRVLILSASVGAGHMRAAQAVELAVRELAPTAVVRNIDLLTLTNPAFRRVYGKAYLELVNRAPHVLGYVYDLMDRPVSSRAKGDRLRLLVEKLNLARFYKMLDAEPWDVAINTHFLPAEIIANLRKQGKLSLPQVTVTTDFETHRLWVNEPCDLYTTATTEGAKYLTHWGVSADRIATTGIPIHPAFSAVIDRPACLRAHGLSGDSPIVLQLAGGFGVGPIVAQYQQLLSVEQPIEVVVVAGKNEAVAGELSQIPVPSRHRATVLGFTTVMHELMAVADLVLTKPGGLTASEVLASGAAMAIVNPIPGQESRNCDYLLEQGAAIKINNLATLASKIEDLLADPGRMSTLKSNAKRIAKPRAAFDIAAKALAM